MVRCRATGRNASAAANLSVENRQGLQVGFFNYLTKPIKIDNLMAALDEALAFSRTAAASAAHKESV